MPGALRRWKVLAALAVPLALAGCFDIGGQGPSTAALTVALPAPVAAPAVLGVPKRLPADERRMIATFGGVYHWAPTETYLDGVLQKLASATPGMAQPYRLTILDAPQVNAFALPSGDIYVTRGLLELANDTSEIAAVMAHEIGHVTAHHAAKRAEFAKRMALISSAAKVVESPQQGAAVESRSELALAQFSRQQELEADKIGIHVIARAGYDPYAAARFLTSLSQSAKLRDAMFGMEESNARPDIMATHPSTPQRVAAALREARAFGPPGIGVRARQAYLNTINGMNFGDSPANGMVEGRVFLQPRLDFGFTAPENFVMQNTRLAVLGIDKVDSEALRLDSVKLGSQTSLTDYFKSGWLDGLDPSTIAEGETNGFPSATAIAHSGPWDFRVAVIRFGADVYRLIFATRKLTPDIDASFMAAIGTFHRLSLEDAARIHPQHLALVTAKAGDTVATLAAGMVGQTQAEDYFRMLNGLSGTASLVVGRSYKVIVQ